METESELLLPKPQFSDNDNITSVNKSTNPQQEKTHSILSTPGQADPKLLNVTTNKEETPSKTPRRLPTLPITPNVINVAESHIEEYGATKKLGRTKFLQKRHLQNILNNEPLSSVNTTKTDQHLHIEKHTTQDEHQENLDDNKK